MIMMIELFFGVHHLVITHSKTDMSELSSIEAPVIQASLRGSSEEHCQQGRFLVDVFFVVISI